MNEFGFATAPDWVQAAMIVGEMLRAFAGRHTTTILSLTEEQSDAVRFAGAFMEGRATRFAEVLMERILRPLDMMPYCESDECFAKGSNCHVHKPAVAAAIIRRWVEIGTPKATAIHGAEVLDETWKILSDLARTTDHGGAKGKIDALAKAAFDKAREIVKEEISTEVEKDRDTALATVTRLKDVLTRVMDQPIGQPRIEIDGHNFGPRVRDALPAALRTEAEEASR